jgi:hypothetical protein
MLGYVSVSCFWNLKGDLKAYCQADKHLARPRLRDRKLLDMGADMSWVILKTY